MIIDCISDLHGHYPKLEGGDLLIVAGDLTARDTPNEYAEFVIWLQCQKYTKRIVIGGNHDNFIQQNPTWADLCNLGFEYLSDSGTEFVLGYPELKPCLSKEEEKVYKRNVLKIWGSPWTKTFEGMNPHCMAFTVDTEEELCTKWDKIPHDVDVLITHSPPFTIRDMTKEGDQVGSTSLMAEHLNRLRPKLWVFGHIHEGYGLEGPYVWNNTKYVNASIVNEHYKPVNKPIRVIL